MHSSFGRPIKRRLASLESSHGASPSKSQAKSCFTPYDFGVADAQAIERKRNRLSKPTSVGGSPVGSENRDANRQSHSPLFSKHSRSADGHGYAHTHTQCVSKFQAGPPRPRLQGQAKQHNGIPTPVKRISAHVHTYPSIFAQNESDSAATCKKRVKLSPGRPKSVSFERTGGGKYFVGTSQMDPKQPLNSDIEVYGVSTNGSRVDVDVHFNADAGESGSHGQATHCDFFL